MTYMNKKTLLICITAAAVIAAAVTSLILLHNNSDDKVAFSVNGIDVTAKELAAEMQDMKWQVSAEFYKKYNQNLSSKDWNKSFGGEIPIERLREISKDKIIEKKIKLTLANENGFSYPTDYDGFYKQMDEVNKNRKDKIHSGGVVYGSKEFTRKTWEAYVFSNIDTSLRESLISVSDEALARYESENIKKFSETEYDVVCDILQVFYGTEGDKEGAFETADKLRSRLVNGEKAESIAKELESDERIKFYPGLVFNNEAAGSNEYAYPKGSELAPSMKEGDISEVVDENFGASIYVCKKAQTSIKMNPNKKQVEYSYREEEYKKLIDRKISETECVINKKVFYKIKLKEK